MCNLEIVFKELLKCQESKNIKSCIPCKGFIDCKLRRAYVNKVYLSMNKDIFEKDNNKGFDFG